MERNDSEQKSIPRLVICGGDNPVLYPLVSSVTTLGRNEKNSIQIHRDKISYRHLEIRELPDGRHRIVDFNSRNGTTVNGISIGSCLLNDGDCIEVGQLITIHYLRLPADSNEFPGGDSEFREFQTLHERLNYLTNQQRVLKNRLRRKTAEYEDLLQAIVDLKRNPEQTFHRLYGDGEIHFPVNFESRITVQGKVEDSESQDTEAVALSG